MILKLILISFVLFSAYKLLLSRLRTFAFNRIFLLVLVIGSIVLSLDLWHWNIELETPLLRPETYEMIDQWQNPNTAEIQLGELKPLQDHGNLWLAIWALGSFLMMARFCIQLNSLAKLTKASTGKHLQMKVVPINDDNSVFSFFNYLFIPNKQKDAILNNLNILYHEKGHAKQLHSADILFIELIQAIFWFNPLWILYKKAIKQNHEFLADEYAIKRLQNTEEFALTLIEFKNPKNAISIASQFSYPLLRSRIKMLQNTKNHKMKNTTAILTSTLLLGTIALLSSFTPVQKQFVEPIEILTPTHDIPSILPIQRDSIKRKPTGFGFRHHPKINIQRKFHKGVDFAAKIGTPVMATADGEVIESCFHEAYGKQVVIKHSETYSTRYAHLSELNVKTGQHVQMKDVIGKVGNTGRSTGPHLHYEVIENGNQIDPKDYFEYEVKE